MECLGELQLLMFGEGESQTETDVLINGAGIYCVRWKFLDEWVDRIKVLRCAMESFLLSCA